MRQKIDRPKTKDHRPKTASRKAATDEPKEFSIPIYNMNGKEVESFPLNKKLFTGKVNKGLLYQAVLMYNANQRRGTASTKTRGEVSGGGKKPWRQKGTGRARAGSTRSPLWRHGGTVFGPHPRDYSYGVPKKIKKRALLASINSKIRENKIIGIDFADIAEPKTKKFQAVLDALKLKGKSLFVLDKIGENVRRASGNIREVSLKNLNDFNTMDVLACENLVLSKAALEKLDGRVAD